MKFEVTHLSSVKKELVIELPAERVARSFNRFSNEFARQARIPGFRPGKAPVALARQRFQKDIHERVLAQLGSEAMQEAIEALKLQVLGEPRVQDVRLTDQLPFVLKVEVDVFPEFTVGALEGLEGVKRVVPVTDADIEASLESLRERLATVSPAEAGRVAQPGDIVTVSLTGYVLEAGATAPADGQSPTIAPRRETLEIGGKSTRAEFDAALRGKAVGERVAVEIQYPPADAGTASTAAPKAADVEDLSGKRVQFHLVIEEIVQKNLPPLDDAWAQKAIGADLATLRARLRADMEAEVEARAMTALDADLLDQLVARVGIEAPESLVTGRVNELLGEFVARLQRQGVDPRRANYDFQKMGEALRPRAEAEIKRIVVLEQVAREAGLRVTDEELSDHIAELAAQVGVAPEVVRARLTREDQLDNVRATLRNRKAMVIVRSAARVETRAVLPADAPAPEEAVSFPSEN
ncbi:MAG: trigger factor [Chloracidobacterium sp. CP2_5A]|nr:MAG: trigger factor [Chloracidobacterium sp. CP2_5A]